MIPPLLRTLSARVVLGFAALIVTFGVTTAWIVAYMEQVSDEIAVIRTGYLNLAFRSKELARKEEDFAQYLDELAGESTAKRVSFRLHGMQISRQKFIEAIDAIIVQLRDAPERHAARIAESRRQLDAIKAAIAVLAPRYETVAQAPPLEQRADGIVLTASARAAAEAARVELVRLEGAVKRQTDELAEYQERMVLSTAHNLELNEQRLSLLTMILGGAAVLIGLLVTIWAAINLRPLRRLRDAARRIAAGDYQSRIDERGPSEVADLAREFNVMGRAVDERERELVRSERLAAVGKMAAMITHEVRNPLSSIGLNTELLEEELGGLPADATAEARALCLAITREVDRLTAITEEYLAFARLPKPRLAAEALNSIVGNLATFVREDLHKRGVTLTLDLADDLPRALVDEGQLRQSLLNLVRNAAEAVADGGGHVWLTTRRGDDPTRVEVEVKDDGPGIEPDLVPRLFDPFFSTKERGTGLGLALTHQIVRDHGGAITVASAPGAGATFVVSVPVSGEPEPRATNRGADDRVAAG
ncbi:MAG: HAMP domain-containing protein [Deltaproteobacteria bacterium]|nr:HAMP domain-containing protein [Deltaproteobacteria bacterium]